MMDEDQLFENVRFFIAQCDEQDEIRHILTSEGARHINYLSEHVTHVIADKICPDAEEAVELFDKPVVKSSWVRFCLRTKRIWPADAFSPFKTTFSNVVASFSRDLTDHDAKILQALITLNGGRLTRNISASTHFISPTDKPTELKDKPTMEASFRIVDPLWVSDSIAQKSRCDETLYDPSLLLSPPPPPPPKLPTPPPPPPQKEQKQMIESNQQQSTVQSDINDRSKQTVRSEVGQSIEEKTRKPDMPQQVRAQVSPRIQQQHQHQQQSQPNMMQQQQQTHIARGPTPIPNVIRGASPRFRPLLPPLNSRQPHPTRIMMTEQQPRRAPLDYNHTYRKVNPGHYPPDMHQAQQQPSHTQSQAHTYQQVEQSQMHQHGPMMNQQIGMPQPNMYHQVRPNYQNSHMSPRMNVGHANSMNPQQLHPHQIQRFQDSNSQMPQPRPYQMSASHQPSQSVNPGYQQTNVQRQPIYYNQATNPQMRMQQPGQMVRGTMMPNEPIMSSDVNHRFPAQQPHYQQQPPTRLPQQMQQQPVPRDTTHKSLPFQPPHPPNVPNQPILQPSKPDAQVLRPQRDSVGNQSDVKLPNKQTGSSPNSEKPQRVPKNTIVNHQPHPSIFDVKQESNYALMKAKVPVLARDDVFHIYAAGYNAPKGKPLLGCKFKLAGYDGLSSKARQLYCDTITAAGAIFTENIEDLTHLICESRVGAIFTEALAKGIRCVTLYWVNDVLNDDRLQYPWKAIHFPTPSTHDGKQLENQVICTTNLGKLDKSYVKIMIEKAGAKYTDYFSRRHTLLICGSPQGEKYERALEWGIPTANCSLISDHWISGKTLEQMISHAKYQIYNKGDQLKLDSYDLIRELMLPWAKPIPAPIEEISPNGLPAETQPTQTDSVTVVSSNSETQATNDVEMKDEVSSEPKKHGEVTVQKDDLKVQISDRTQTEDSIMIEKSTIVNTSDTSETIGTSCDLESITVVKVSTNIVENKGEDATEAKTDLPNMIVRKSDTPVRVLFTRLKPELHAQLEKYATGLGFELAPSYVECTHLVVDRISRSPRFICAFNHADYILSIKWLVDSHEHGKPLDELSYILQDHDGERKYSFDLVHSMIKRRNRSHLLFHNFVFFITPTPQRRVIDLTEMIRSAGAICCTRRLPTGNQIAQLKSEGKRFVVIADKQDGFLLESIEAMNVDIVDPEFVLSGILRQDLDFDAHRLNQHLTNGHQKELSPLSLPSPLKRIRHV